MSYKTLIVKKEGHVATVVLNRPEKLNALRADIMTEIGEVADSFQHDYETRVVVFTGEGRYFSSGADLSNPDAGKMAEATTLERQRHSTLGQRMTAKLLAMNQITIAAINGGAIGGGAVVASALDFRVAADDSFVSYPEINLGLSLSWYGLPLALRLVGPARAKRLVIGGARESAQTLLEWGFYDEIVPLDQLMDRAMEMAEFYAAKPPIPAQMIKRSVNALSGAMDQAIMHMDADQLMVASGTKDSIKAKAEFFENGTPEFRGD